MQEEGPISSHADGPLRLSRILKPEDTRIIEETVSVRRALFWGVIALILVLGIVLYFKYERLLVPLLG